MFCYAEVISDRKRPNVQQHSNSQHPSLYKIYGDRLTTKLSESDAELKFTLQYTKELRNVLALPCLSWA